jgi:hypothetical protein
MAEMTNSLDFLTPEDREWLASHGYEERGDLLVRLPEFGDAACWMVPLDDDDREMFESVQWLPRIKPLALAALCMRAADRSRLFRGADEGTAKLARWPKPAVERLITAAFYVNSMVRT